MNFILISIYQNINTYNNISSGNIPYFYIQHNFHLKYFIDKSIGLDNRLCLYKSSPTTRWNNRTQFT